MEEEEVYQTFESVQKQQVIFCNTATTDYFTLGCVEPQVMLNDLKMLFESDTIYQPTYFKWLK